MTVERRRFIDANGVAWTFTPRPHVRTGEENTHVTLLLESAWEARVATCPRDDWDRPHPNFARLLSESLPAGASRGMHGGDSGDAPTSPRSF